jgi:hypothetical protein
MSENVARFFFDPGSGGVLWMRNEAEWASWGNPVDTKLLPISESLREELARLVESYDSSLNWDYPPDPGPWREQDCERFNLTAREALNRLREELGPTWTIVDEFQDLHEDPDLDRYLTSPSTFHR